MKITNCSEWTDAFAFSFHYRYVEMRKKMSTATYCLEREQRMVIKNSRQLVFMPSFHFIFIVSNSLILGVILVATSRRFDCLF